MYFQANRESPVFPELSSLLMKTAGLGQVLAENLADRREHIQVAFIFGSYAGERRAQRATSIYSSLAKYQVGRSQQRSFLPRRL
jgi:hypothetical protein